MFELLTLSTAAMAFAAVSGAVMLSAIIVIFSPAKEAVYR